MKKTKNASASRRHRGTTTTNDDDDGNENLPLALVPITPAAKAAQRLNSTAPVTLLATPRVQLGRAAHPTGASLVFARDCLTVSAVHAVLVLDPRGGGGYILQDHSSNGTWLDGERLERCTGEELELASSSATAAAVAARMTSRRADGPRTAAWLSLVSFGVLTASILWGLFGVTRHGGPPVQPAAAQAAGQHAFEREVMP